MFDVIGKYWREIIVFLIFCLISKGVAFSQILINEVCAKNTCSYLDPGTYNYPSWIELYNTGSTAVNLHHYKIILKSEIEETWIINNNISISGKSFLLILTDGLNSVNHGGFKINGDPATLILKNSSNAILDSIHYERQSQDISLGRNPVNPLQWVYFKEPSPNKANNTNIIELNQTAQPLVSNAGGFFSGPINISINTAQGGVTYYSLDGSIPDSTGTIYTSPIYIGSTKVLRARSYRLNEIPSEIATATYFINEHYSELPIISLSCSPDFLFDDIIGMYADGTNGIPGNCVSDPVNWNQDWERAANIEYFENGTSIKANFASQAGIKINGACSRGNPQKSLSVTFKEKYNTDKLNFHLFKSKSNTSFNSFVLRNSGNDYGNTLIRDAVIQTVTEGKMDLDYMAHQPVVVYINGNYWGIYNMQEKLDEDYIQSNYYYTPDMFDLLEYFDSPVIGQGQRYDNLLAFIESNELSVSGNYDYVKSQIDIQEYINYQVAEIFCGNTDWPGNNIKFWSKNDGTGKWRWILYDTDFGFGIWGFSPAENTLTFALQEGGTGWPNPDWSTLLFRNLMKSEEFKQQFLNTFLLHLGSTFRYDKVSSIIDSMQNLLLSEMPYHIQRWHAPGSADEWQGNIDQMKSYVYQRPAYILQYLSEYYTLNTAYPLVIRNLNTDNCYLQINGIDFKDTLFYGQYFSDIPVHVVPVLKEGSEVIKWDLYKQDYYIDTLIQAHSIWNYLDIGSDLGTAWRNPGYDDSGWKTGYGKLGYGDDDNNTTLEYGSDDLNKYITTYFRKEFQYISDPNDDSIIVNIVRDDGVVVYLNGAEIIRDNMPGGSVSYTTLAAGAASDETSYYTFSLSAGLLMEGTNTIAVELHQSSASSSDIGFDLEMHLTQGNNNSYRELYNPELTFYVDSLTYLNLETQVVNDPSPLYLNEFLTDNDDGLTDEFGDHDSWLEIYNPNDYDIDLSGLCLTDDKNNPKHYRIPTSFSESAIIQAHGFKVIWTDKEPLEGTFHASFKLNMEPGFLGLYDPNFNCYIDSVSYKIQESDISFGRETDGAPLWTMQAIRTPGASNISFQTITYNNEVEDGDFLIYPNPSDRYIRIKTPDNLLQNTGDHNISIEIINLSGEIVYIDKLDGRIIDLNLQNLNNGLYLVKIKSPNKVQTTKLIINR